GADAVRSGGGPPVGRGRAHVTRNGTDVVRGAWPTTTPRSSPTTPYLSRPQAPVVILTRIHETASAMPRWHTWGHSSKNATRSRREAPWRGGGGPPAPPTRARGGGGGGVGG